MKIKKESYTLYLDESKMRIGDRGEDIYCVAGVVIWSKQIKLVRHRLKELKLSIWNKRDRYSPSPSFRSIHQAEIRNPTRNVLLKRPYMATFRSRKKQLQAIKGVGSIIRDFDFPIIGALVNEKQLSDNYGCHQDSYTSYYASLKAIIEDFAHFLNNKHTIGRIILESRADAAGNINDQRVKKDFYKILSNGTIRYSAIELQRLIQSISFYTKTQNDAGLQIADYVPRAFLYKYASKQNSNITQPKPTIFQVLRKQRYDGGDSSVSDRYARHGIIIID